MRANLFLDFEGFSPACDDDGGLVEFEVMHSFCPSDVPSVDFPFAISALAISLHPAPLCSAFCFRLRLGGFASRTLTLILRCFFWAFCYCGVFLSPDSIRGNGMATSRQFLDPAPLSSAS